MSPGGKALTGRGTPPAVSAMAFVPYYLDAIKYQSDGYKAAVKRDMDLRRKLHDNTNRLTHSIYSHKKNIKSVYFSDLAIEMPLSEEEFWKCRKYQMLNQNHYEEDEKKGICKIINYEHYNAYSGTSQIKIFPLKKCPEFLRPFLPDITVLESTSWDFPRMDIVVQAKNTKGWDDQGGLISQTILLPKGKKPDFSIAKEQIDWHCKTKCNKKFVNIEKIVSISGECHKSSGRQNLEYNRNNVVKTVLHKRTCVLTPFDGFLGNQINKAVENSNVTTMIKLMKEMVRLNDSEGVNKMEWGTLEKSIYPYTDNDKVLLQ